VIEEQRSHDQHLQQILAFDHPFQSTEETKEPWESFNGDQALELEIEEFLASLCLDPLYKIKIFEYLQGYDKGGHPNKNIVKC
jgi:hypothetical protein